MNGTSVFSASREAACVVTPAIRMPQPGSNTDQPGTSRAPESSLRRLLIREDVLLLLHLCDEQVQQLINTGQLTPFLLAGEERFDSRDVYHLIDAYMCTAARRPQ